MRKSSSHRKNYLTVSILQALAISSIPLILPNLVQATSYDIDQSKATRPNILAQSTPKPSPSIPAIPSPPATPKPPTIPSPNIPSPPATPKPPNIPSPPATPKPNIPSPPAIPSGKILLDKQGELITGDKILPTDNSLYDEYTFEGKKDQKISIKAESKDFDTYLAIFTPAGDLLAEHDDISEQDSNSAISVTLPADGNYRLIINAYDKDGKGKYILRVLGE
ncbi:MAG: PPC domain-containing protein [Microcoleaceae cyanobacterium]